MSDSFATPWSAACQAPLSMAFPRQEHWSGLPSPSPGDLSSCSLECYLLNNYMCPKHGGPSSDHGGEELPPYTADRDKSATPTQTVAVSIKQINRVTPQEIRRRGGVGDLGRKVERSFQWWHESWRVNEVWACEGMGQSIQVWRKHKCEGPGAGKCSLLRAGLVRVREVGRCRRQHTVLKATVRSWALSSSSWQTGGQERVKRSWGVQRTVRSAFCEHGMCLGEMRWEMRWTQAT